MDNQKEKDLNIFFRYVFNPKGLLDGIVEGIKDLFKPKPFSSILIVISILSFLRYSKPKGSWIALFCISLALIIQLRQIYKSGEHRAWNRQRKGMKTKKQLLKEEFDLRNKQEGKEGERSQVERD